MTFPSRPIVSRGRVPSTLLVLLVVLVAATTACSSSTDPAPGDAAQAAAGGGPFPVTIAHKYGETTITAVPQRIVTVGLTDQDSVVALGATPVGTTDWFGDHPGALWPWAASVSTGPVPEVVSDASTVGFEKIASLTPDLILAVYSGITQEDYDKLSALAPTVAQPAEHVDFGVPWDQQTLTIGRAMGKVDEAQRLVDEVQAKFDAAKQAHPEFEGATGLVASKYSDSVAVYAPQDVRGRLLASLGFVQPPEIAQLAGQEFSATLSNERIDLLDVDALVWIVNDIETDVARYDADPIYSQLPVHKNKRDVFVENLSELGGGLSFATVLSLPPVLEGLVPQLATAVKGGT